MTIFKQTFELCSKFVHFFSSGFIINFFLLYKRIGMLFEEKKN